MDDEIKGMFEAMKALLNVMGEKIISDGIAKVMRGLYTSLVEQGFTEEQAMSIVTKVNLFNKQ